MDACATRGVLRALGKAQWQRTPPPHGGACTSPGAALPGGARAKAPPSMEEPRRRGRRACFE
eukprot:8195055-Alexandrium_andersonii.AAC.1